MREGKARETSRNNYLDLEYDILSLISNDSKNYSVCRLSGILSKPRNRIQFVLNTLIQEGKVVKCIVVKKHHGIEVYKIKKVK